MERGGHERPHFHPSGWLSGVYYVKVPKAVPPMPNEKAGWIEFGRPPEHLDSGGLYEVRLVEPREGMLLLFPSYFFHRTIPTDCDEERISVAFDVISA